MVKMNNSEEFYRNIINRTKNNLSRQLERERTSAIVKGLRSALDPEKFMVTQKENKGAVKEVPKAEEGTDKVIDMKPFFRRSSKAKPKLNGGWYLVVPIKRYTSSSKRKQASGMYYKMYEDLRKIPMDAFTKSRTVVSDYLYMNRDGYSPVQDLEYTPKSKNITKTTNRAKVKQKKSYSYISFRTVSDKSSPASWLLNRGTATEENMRDSTRLIAEAARRYNIEFANRQNR